jgi:hypothetical protein
VVYLKDSGINPDFRTLKGKRIGYVGEFGKVCAGAKSIIIDICQRYARSKSTSSPRTTA